MCFIAGTNEVLLCLRAIVRDGRKKGGEEKDRGIPTRETAKENWEEDDTNEEASRVMVHALICNFLSFFFPSLATLFENLVLVVVWFIVSTTLRHGNFP